MKEKFLKIAKKLGFLSKIKEEKMTSEDWDKFAAEFKKEYGIDLIKALDDAKKAKSLKKEHQEALAAMLGDDDPGEDDEDPDATDEDPDAGEDDPDDDGSADEGADPQGEPTASTPAKKAVKKSANLATEARKLAQRVKKLEADPEPPAGKKVTAEPKKIIGIMGSGHTATHVFGFKSDFFSRSHPWNEITATMKPRERWSRGEEEAFKGAFDKYAESFSERVNFLQRNGLLAQLKVQGGKFATDSIDYSSFDDSGYGEEYVVRRQDALIAYIRSLPSVGSIFPVRYGVQNKMEMTNSFFGEFSQAYQSGKVYKGSFILIPELAKVDDVMFKHSFTNLKQLEKEYVGYLNREGSDPIKWTFIEWLIMKTLVVLHNEQEQRRVRGYRIDPTTGTAGHYMFGSDGVIRRLRAYAEEFKLQPYTTTPTYTSSTILAFVEAFVEDVNKVVPSLRGHYLYMNEKHIPWYKAAYRSKYGTDLDFKGGVLQVMDYAIDGIVPVPHMGNLTLMFITQPGNVELYEYVAGEMEKLYFQRDLEELIVASWWKEGSGAYLTGKKFADAATLAASNRKYQFIFLAGGFNELAADATTCDALDGDVFKTIANTGATAITNITNAEEGIVYRVECGSATNATTIAKSGYFSNLTAAWIPTAVGDYLEVYWNSTTSKFVEVRRQVTT